ncbi:hypothetical protein ACFRU3_13865 [Streptomyces sp. NPDC056910]|uniref:hypothetical protein n=1 Tax=Streptomyces sp. NPDC056910 TaxID=3345964 RepID=UPI0036B4061E
MPAVDWAPSAAEGDKALYLFDGEQLTPEFLGRITLQADELKSFEFLAPDEIEQRTISRPARRLCGSDGLLVFATGRALRHARVHAGEDWKPACRAARANMVDR